MASGGRPVGVAAAAGGAAVPEGAGPALAAQAVAVGGGAARAAEPVGPQRVGRRAVVVVAVVVGVVGVVRVVCRHADDVPPPGRYAITTQSDMIKTSLVRCPGSQDVLGTNPGRLTSVVWVWVLDSGGRGS